jgi:hypothetical protein
LLFLHSCAQPGPPDIFYSVVSIRTDPGVFVNNENWILHSFHSADSPFNLVRSKNSYFHITPSYNNLIRLDNGEVALRISLIKDSLTMNIHIIKHSYPFDYAIQYIPFKQGDYVVDLPENISEQSDKTYVKGRTGYVRTMVGDTIQTFDITEFVEKKLTVYNEKDYQTTAVKSGEIDCESLKGKWAISNIVIQDNILYGSDITLINKGTCGFEYKLEVNLCGIAFDIFDTDSIAFYNPVCTEECCDFGSREVAFMRQMTQIVSFTDDIIILEGEAIIPNSHSELEQQEEKRLTDNVQVTLQRLE